MNVRDDDQDEDGMELEDELLGRPRSRAGRRRRVVERDRAEDEPEDDLTEDDER